MLSPRSAVLALVAALSTGACSTLLSEPPRGGSPMGGVVVEVSNLNWADMVVYAVRGGSKHRLGMVPSMTTRVLPVPQWLVHQGSPLRLASDPIGSYEVYTTQPISVLPGQWIELTLQNHLAISSFAVWSR